LILWTSPKNRFPGSYHLYSYAGLVPSTYSSGGTTYHGSITKRRGKHLLWIMLECVHVHIGTNKNSNITQFYTRLAKIKVSSICSRSIKVTKNCLLDYEREIPRFSH